MRTVTLAASLLSLLLGTSGALAASICIVPSPGGNNITVDCNVANQMAHPNATRGYSIDAVPCQTGSCFFLPKRGGQDYSWSISASSVDPYVNSGPLPQFLAYLYLWMDCSLVGGAAAVEFSFETDDPSFFLIGIEPEPFVLNAGTASDPLLAIGGCPDAPVRIATLTMLNVVPISTEPETWGGIKALYR